MSDTSSLTDISTAPPHATDDIDLLDVLVVIADNLKLLILAPLAVGVLGLGIGFLLPQTFESTSIFNPAKPGTSIPPQLVASLVRSADILEQVGQELGIKQGGSKAQRLREMEERVSVSAGKQDQLVTLVTRGSTPEEAQRLNQTLWNHVYPLLTPRPKEMARLQEQLKAEKERLSAGTTLEQSTAKLLSAGNTAESTARLYGELLASNSKRLRDIAGLESQIEGVTEENLAQQPTLPELASKPKKALIAIGATLATGLLLLLFIFGRSALQGASNDPEQASKVQRLRAALGMKS